MGSVTRVKTPQFRAQLTRRLRNLFPSCEPEFDQAERGIAFRLRDRRGRYRSNQVRFYRYHGHILDRAGLLRAIWRAGVPPGGFPRDP